MQNYVISLTTSTDRRQHITQEFKKQDILFEFFDAITRAETVAEVRMVAQWQQHMPEDYRAIRDFLERRFPERWGRKDKVQQEISGPDGGPIQWVDLVRLANDDEPDKPDS